MADAAEVTTNLKRKRAAVSYVADEYFDNLEIGESFEAELDIEGDDAEHDFRNTKGRAKKAKLTKQHKKAGKKEKPFRFLDLPPELRDQIYEHALVDHLGIVLVAKTKHFRRSVTRGRITTESSSSYRGKRRRYRWYSRTNGDSATIGDSKSTELIPNLLAVNKQIRYEASAMLYHQEIVVEDTSVLQTFVAQIGPHNRNLLTNITLKGWGEGKGVHKGRNFSALSILSTCTNLEKVFLDCSVGWCLTPVRLARQIFRDGHYLLEALGAAKGKYDAGLDVLEICDWHFDKNRTGSRYWSSSQNGESEYDPEKREEFDREIRKLLKRR